MRSRPSVSAVGFEVPVGGVVEVQPAEGAHERRVAAEVALQSPKRTARSMFYRGAGGEVPGGPARTNATVVGPSTGV